jgi:hypothetical protein
MARSFPKRAPAMRKPRSIVIARTVWRTYRSKYPIGVVGDSRSFPGHHRSLHTYGLHKAVLACGGRSGTFRFCVSFFALQGEK